MSQEQLLKTALDPKESMEQREQSFETLLLQLQKRGAMHAMKHFDLWEDLWSERWVQQDAQKMKWMVKYFGTAPVQKLPKKYKNSVEYMQVLCQKILWCYKRLVQKCVRMRVF